ncbi:MAG: hypothetical protein GF408_01660 [Candidatus Omnitrophica bacterium]|nr:hypothetical protein [Candidatus Omnitrophota bacterium]
MIIYEEVLREFNRRKVKYIIVGGIAMNLLGGYRNTLDMDVLVEMSDANLQKIVTILKELGYSVRQPVDPFLIADKNTRNDWVKNKNMKAFNFYKGKRSYEEVDIIIDSPVSYERASKNMVKVKVGRMTLPVVSVKDFIKMKKHAGREKDLLDIKEVKIARGRK